MTFDEIVSKRKSIRDYEDKPVEKEKVLQVLQAARLAPSACNKQPWRFVIVESPEAKNLVLKEGFGGAIVPNKWAKTAPIIIVVCSQTDIIFHNIAEKIQGVNYHLIDLGIACQNLVLKACDLGLGTCYIGWFKGKAIKKVLGLPSSYKVECLITLGYPTKAEPISTQRKNIEEISLWK